MTKRLWACTVRLFWLIAAIGIVESMFDVAPLVWAANKPVCVVVVGCMLLGAVRCMAYFFGKATTAKRDLDD